jgi:DNA-binding PadR family transcriptional regulator
MPIERFLPLTPTRFHILLALTESVQHGYEIRRTVEERSDGRISLPAASLYETLPRLLRDGFAEEVSPPGDGDAEPTSRWRFYRITDLGRQLVQAETHRLESEAAWAREALAKQTS